MREDVGKFKKKQEKIGKNAERKEEKWKNDEKHWKCWENEEKLRKLGKISDKIQTTAKEMREKLRKMDSVPVLANENEQMLLRNAEKMKKSMRIGRN